MNRQSFDLSTEKGREHFQKFLDVLIDYNQDYDNSDYNDIHIKTEDCDIVVIEWEKVHYSDASEFVYLKEDEVVMKVVRFPDEHIEYLFPEEVDDRLKEWQKEHPEWIIGPLGTWTNAEENKKWQVID